jgi:hypothetical protein
MIARAAQRPVIAIVVREGRCIGTILSRGPAGFEGFDSCDRSLGVFETAAGANAAVHRSRAA